MGFTSEVAMLLTPPPGNQLRCAINHGSPANHGGSLHTSVISDLGSSFLFHLAAGRNPKLAA